MNRINYNIYVFTTKAVLRKGQPILRVIHDTQGDWQFLSDEFYLKEDDAMLVSLGEILDYDRTVSEIISIPKGKQAIRESKGEAWHVYDFKSA